MAGELGDTGNYPPVATGGRVLIGALDWGLGHAARSCVLARRYRDAGWRVHLAASGAAGRLLRAEFPDLPYAELPAYGVRYPGSNMYLNIARQLPQLLRAGYREYRWLRRFHHHTPLDLVISDSRFGLRLAAVPSVFLTHQTEPLLHSLAAVWALPIYRAILRRFSAIWVPDTRGPNRLSGKLSRSTHYLRVEYIGPLSRFSAYAQRELTPAWDTVTLLSGPEPQRTRLEAELLPQLQNLPGCHLLIRGLPGTETLLPTLESTSLVIQNASYGADLAHQLAAARLIICRSGYSTLMDLRALDKPALLIPTPGQTEQIYLARRAEQQGWAQVQGQGAVDLATALSSSGRSGLKK